MACESTTIVLEFDEGHMEGELVVTAAITVYLIGEITQRAIEVL